MHGIYCPQLVILDERPDRTNSRVSREQMDCKKQNHHHKIA